MKRTFHFTIEICKTGGYIGRVIEFDNCFSYSENLDDLGKKVKSAIKSRLKEKSSQKDELMKFIGLLLVEV